MREATRPNTPQPSPASEREDQAHSRPPNPQAAIELLRAWRQGDEEAQREPLASLQQALDADRLSNRTIFSAQATGW